MIIGLTGTNAAGKGEVAEYLKKKGLKYISLSDELRKEAKNRKLEPTRENLINLGNELRKKFGPEYLAKKISKKIKGDTIVDSIRNLHELDELRNIRDFIFVAIDAPVELRYKRALERKRIGDNISLEQFKNQERLENSDDEKAQQLNRCLKSADIIIINDGTLEELHKKVDKTWKDLHGTNTS
jgi:dephospho-CoA kinase